VTSGIGTEIASVSEKRGVWVVIGASDGLDEGKESERHSPQIT
jgi:hypothetical protein